MNPHQSEYVGSIVSASRALRDLINDILDLSQIDSGTMALDLEDIDLHHLLSMITDQVQTGAVSLGLTINLECSSDAGRFVDDRNRIGQVMFSLLSNAVRFTPRGGSITVGGRILGDDVELWVSDTGPGLPQEAMPAAFERFVARSSAGKSGAGLGLALVNHFVQLHNGWVELESAADKGTKVTCYLPRNATTRAANAGEDTLLARATG